MKVIIFLAIFALANTHVNQPFITKEHIQEISEKASFETYSFEEHPFKNWSESDIRSLLGTILPSTTPTAVDMGGYCDAPESFDGRVQWPNYIHRIRNQQHCGSCWAFAASEVLSDRFSIATNGQVNIVLSPQDMVSCDTSDMGCNGGYPDYSWQYLVNDGIVSDECLPYSSGDGSSAYCPYNYFQNRMCPTGAKFHKYHARNYRHFSNNCDIKKSLMTEGPVETGFMVFSDLMSYRSGIYRSNCYQQMGGHAVKIVGWGKEYGVEYWIVANSWGEQWGENGYIRIQTGQSCLNLDTNCIAGTPDVSRLMKETFSETE